MPKVSVEKAFSPRPTHRLDLGERALDVPPLTLGRFLALSGCDFNALTVALAAGAIGAAPRAGSAETMEVLKGVVARAKAGADPDAIREAFVEEHPDMIADLGTALAAIDYHAFTPLVCAAVPDLEPAEWDAHGNPIKALDLFAFFLKVHDWTFIGDTIGFGKPKEKDEKSTTGSTVSGALVAFCRAHPFYSPEQLLEMRVEGFFHLRVGAEEAHKAREEAQQEYRMAAPETGGTVYMDEAAFCETVGAVRAKANPELMAKLDAADALGPL